MLCKLLNRNMLEGFQQKYYLSIEQKFTDWRGTYSSKLQILIYENFHVFIKHWTNIGISFFSEYIPNEKYKYRFPFGKPVYVNINLY